MTHYVVYIYEYSFLNYFSTDLPMTRTNSESKKWQNYLWRTCSIPIKIGSYTMLSLYYNYHSMQEDWYKFTSSSRSINGNWHRKIVILNICIPKFSILCNIPAQIRWIISTIPIKMHMEMVRTIPDNSYQKNKCSTFLTVMHFNIQ